MIEPTAEKRDAVIWNPHCSSAVEAVPAPRVVIPAEDNYVEINGYAVPLRSCVIHFYYTRAEQQRLLGFLLDGVARHEPVVLACSEGAHEILRDGLEMLGVEISADEIVIVQISPDLPSSIANVDEAIADAMKRHGGQTGRLLCDFGSIVGQESIFELEGALNSALNGSNVVCVTQYDGRNFGAPITIEQFQTHALAIVGNAFFRENRHYTPPEAYYRRRAAGGRR